MGDELGMVDGDSAMSSLGIPVILINASKKEDVVLKV